MGGEGARGGGGEGATSRTLASVITVGGAMSATPAPLFTATNHCICICIRDVDVITWAMPEAVAAFATTSLVKMRDGGPTRAVTVTSSATKGGTENCARRAEPKPAVSKPMMPPKTLKSACTIALYAEPGLRGGGSIGGAAGGGDKGDGGGDEGGSRGGGGAGDGGSRGGGGDGARIIAPLSTTVTGAPRSATPDPPFTCGNHCNCISTTDVLTRIWLMAVAVIASAAVIAATMLVGGPMCVATPTSKAMNGGTENLESRAARNPTTSKPAAMPPTENVARTMVP